MHVGNYSEGKKESSLYTNKLERIISGTDKCYIQKRLSKIRGKRLMGGATLDRVIIEVLPEEVTVKHITD